jgi:hypothetical protein
MMSDRSSDAFVFFAATGDLAHKKILRRCRRRRNAAISTCRSSAWPKPGGHSISFAPGRARVSSGTAAWMPQPSHKLSGLLPYVATNGPRQP